MAIAGNSALQTVVSSLAVGGMYAFAFWRIARLGKNKVIEFGGLALGCFFVIALASKVGDGIAFWAVTALYLLFSLLSCLTMVFLVCQGYQALRRRKTSRGAR